MTQYKEFAETEREHAQRLGEYVRTTRRKIGKTQSQLAAAIGVLQSTIAAIEQGRTRLTVHRARLIAAYFGVSMDEFASGGRYKEDRIAALADRVKRAQAEISRLKAEQ